jgi:hypothetical protein
VNIMSARVQDYVVANGDANSIRQVWLTS